MVFPTPIQNFGLGHKCASVDEFPFCCHLVSDEYEELLSEALEAAQRLCNQQQQKGFIPSACPGISKTVSCAGADRLQTGMRGAWGKLYGTVACVNIGQIIFLIHCKENNARRLPDGFVTSFLVTRRSLSVRRGDSPTLTRVITIVEEG